MQPSADQTDRVGDRIDVCCDPQDHQSCYEACQTANSSLRDMPQTLDALRIAARCLYLRQLLSEAAKAELHTQAPAVSGLMSAGESPAACARPVFPIQAPTFLC